MNNKRIIRYSSVLWVFLLCAGCSTAKVVNLKAPNFDTVSKRTVEAGAAAIEPKRLLPEHEKLTFDVKWAGIHIGTLTSDLHLEKSIEGQQIYRIETNMESNGLLSVIYRFADRYVSTVDPVSLVSLKHEVYGTHGSRRKSTITTFDHLKHTARFQNLLNGSEKIAVIPDGTQDLLSSVYHLQVVPLRVGDNVVYDVFNIERYYRLTYVVIGKARVMLPQDAPQAHDAFLIEPQAYSREDGDIERGKIKLYFSTDDRRVLLFAEVDGPMFTKITFTLKSIDYSPLAQSAKT